MQRIPLTPNIGGIMCSECPRSALSSRLPLNLSLSLSLSHSQHPTLPGPNLAVFLLSHGHKPRISSISSISNHPPSIISHKPYPLHPQHASVSVHLCSCRQAVFRLHHKSLHTTSPVPSCNNSLPPFQIFSVMLPPPATTITSHSSGMSLPIVAIAILGILTTAIFLLTYYIFVIKCCLHWRTSDLLLRLSPRSRRRPIASPTSDPGVPSAAGLDLSAIRAIPTFRFSAAACGTGSECAVCLLEFRAAERLRLLQGCNHAFHIDCIDTWLQSSASCPLCRAEVTDPLPMLAQHLNSAQSVVVDVREETAPRKQRKRVGQGVSMGDECIEVRREKDEQFDVQPMRRSLSMDSSGDRQLYLSVQEILRRNPDRLCGEESSNAGGGSGRVRRSFFSFGHGRSSRSVVRPVDMNV